MVITTGFWDFVYSTITRVYPLKPHKMQKKNFITSKHAEKTLMWSSWCFRHTATSIHRYEHHIILDNSRHHKKQSYWPISTNITPTTTVRRFLVKLNALLAWLINIHLRHLKAWLNFRLHPISHHSLLYFIKIVNK